jgi:hypothetical protein
MKHLFLAFVTTLVMMSGANAREVAFCTPGFNVQTVSGDKAVCAKTEVALADVGPRKCLTDGHRTSELLDGGDLCQGAGFGGLPGPALDCKLSYGPDAQNKLVKGGLDRCEKNLRRTVFGNISTRSE